MEQQSNIHSVDLSTGLGYGVIFQPIIGQKPACIQYPLPIRFQRKSLRQPTQPKRR